MTVATAPAMDTTSQELMVPSHLHFLRKQFPRRSAACPGKLRSGASRDLLRFAQFPRRRRSKGRGHGRGGVVILRHRRSPHKMREPARGSGTERIPALVLLAEARCVWLAAPAVHLSQPESWGSPRIQIGDLSPPCAAEIAPAFLRCLGERRVGTRQ